MKHNEDRPANHLAGESSPYLLQHAYNPVDWYPWGNEALERAKKENKLMVISIGYAACHWCHVMEKESFEDTAVARVMNEDYIAIKVDREERPDIDDVYMTACQIISQWSGQGGCGWPLNIIALPDARPVFAGTYFPKENWIKVLEYFTNLRTEKPGALEKQASQLLNGIQQLEYGELNTRETGFSASDLQIAFDNWKKHLDLAKGGRTGAPKFPMPVNYRYLLRYYHFSGDEMAREAVTTTLDQMAFGGIYDQIGGGFARYSVDADWEVPHFEKMLYDNAQLVSLYSEAYQLSGNPVYRDVVYETIEFIKRELTSGEGGFFSSLDADSEGEEGKYYVWQKAETDRLLGEQANLINSFYHITEAGNWEHGKNILMPKKSLYEFAKDQQREDAEVIAAINDAREILFKARNERARPGLDDKILSSWNGLMLEALAIAYRVFGEDSFLDMARRNAAFLLDKQIDHEGKLWRNYKDGQSSINAFLDDYAAVISAFIALYQATFEESWLQQADLLTQYTLAHYFDETHHLFYYTSDLDDPLIVRRKEISDNVIPSSNSMMGRNLLYLGHLLGKSSYTGIATKMLHGIAPKVREYPSFNANWLSLWLDLVNAPFEVAILGEEAIQFRKQFDRQYLPNALFLGGAQEGELPLLQDKLVDGQTTIYVCINKSCKLPVTEVSKALEIMD